MPDMWMPGAKRHSIGNTGSMNGGPSRVIWHATSNSSSDSFSAHVGWFTGGGRSAAPTLLWHPYTGEIAQFFPANSRALSVRNAGNVQTNRTGKYCVQIEVCFTKNLRPGVTHISQTPCKGLDKIMAWLNSLGIAASWPGGSPTGWSRDTVSLNTWLNKGGHYGHNQVPGNDHVDPGKMPNLFKLDGGDPETPPSAATSHTVKSGDTLWGLARKYGVSITNLKKWNDLKSDEIFPGDVLKLKAPQSKVTKYAVKVGDTLWGIARKFKISVGKLKSLNSLKSNVIHPGDNLIVDPESNEIPEPPEKEEPEVKDAGSWIWFDNAQPGQENNNSTAIVQRALKFEFPDFDYIEGRFGSGTEEYYAKWQRKLGYSGSDADGKPGKASIEALADKYNFDVRYRDVIKDAGGWIYFENARPGTGKTNSTLIVQKALKFEFPEFDYSSGPGYYGPETKKFYAKWQKELGYSGSDADGIPGTSSLGALAKKYKFEIRHKKSGSGNSSGGRVSSPVPGHSVTFPYGVKRSHYAAGYHTGDDYAASTGTPVVAVRNGTVQWSNGSGGAYGSWIGLRADNGRVYVYCHLSSRSVSAGQKVKAGQQLGRVGSTGNVTGPHLHFEDHPSGGFTYAECREPRW